MSFANPQPPYPNPQHGQRYEWAVRMYDYKARFYDPRTAMFSSLDAKRQYVNPYAYVMWNPIAFADPTGMLTVPEAGGASGLNFAMGYGISQGAEYPSLSDLQAAGLAGDFFGGGGVPSWVPNWY